MNPASAARRTGRDGVVEVDPHQPHRASPHAEHGAAGGPDGVVRRTAMVGAVDDPAEAEAERTADLVVQARAGDPTHSWVTVAPGRPSRIRRTTRVPSAEGTTLGRDSDGAVPLVSAGPVATSSHLIRRAGFTYAGNPEIRGSISTQKELRDGIEGLLDGTFVGVRALFEAGGVATSVEAWGGLLYGLLAEDNDMEGLTPTDCADIVETIKAENRKEQFLQISEFYGYFEESYKPAIWTLDDFKGELNSHHINVDDDGKDDATLEALLAARGDREKAKEDPERTFQFGTETHELDIKGLKSTLDEKLGTTVNWGHEITDCLDNSGKTGEMYYYQTGVGLTQVGTTTQSHASSKGGRTIIWETSGETTEILAIGKHTTRADTRLSKGASYEIVETFGAGYAGYVGKIIGFKA